MNPPLEETFAGDVGNWRVVDNGTAAGEHRFSVVGRSRLGGGDVEICRVAYRPHAEAIAALPELAFAASNAVSFYRRVEGKEPGRRSVFKPLADAIAKAEGRN